MNRTGWMLAAVTAAALLAGCSSANSSPAASTSGYDQRGTVVPGDADGGERPGRDQGQARPDRLAVGNGDRGSVRGRRRAAGRGRRRRRGNSNYPANAPVTKLSGLTPNLEAIASYKPALVIASENSNGLVSGLGKLHVPVLMKQATATLNDAYDQIVQIGQATGHAQQAGETVATMKSEIAADVEQAGVSRKDLTYYWELSSNPYYSVTSSTFIGQIVSLFGLKNIADAASKASDGGYPELSQEYIVTARPAIIFLADNQPADGGQSPAIVTKRPGYAQAIPAVKDHEIIALNDDIASRWGPRLPQLVAQIAQAVDKAPGWSEAASVSTR